MKIAILLFGQPRFFEFTVNRIKEEFSIPGHEFDYFIHFWKDVGYTPYDDKYQKYTNTNIQKYIDVLEPKSVLLTDYDILDEFTHNFDTVKKFLSNTNIKHIQYQTASRYSYGQHFSLKLAYKQLAYYEKRNKIKYDTVVKARTDFIFKDAIQYQQEEEYYKLKTSQYILNEEYGDNYIKAFGCAQQKYNEEKNIWELCERYDIFDPSEKKHKRDLYNIIRSGDVALTATRRAAEQYFNRWFDVFLQTYITDMRNNTNNPQLQLHRRHDGLQGEIALLNNIKIIKPITPRDHRVVLRSNCKDKWIKENTIVLEDFTDAENNITKQLYNIYNK